jgi:hypothetical protein
MDKYYKYYHRLSMKCKNNNINYIIGTFKGYSFDVHSVQSEREIPHVTVLKRNNNGITIIAKVKLPPKDAYYLKPDYIYVMWYNQEYFKKAIQLTWFKHTMCKLFLSSKQIKCEGGYSVDQNRLEDMWDKWDYCADIKLKYMVTPTSKEYHIQPPSEETYHYYSHHD